MTLNDILTAALAQLDRGHDPQTMEAFAPRLTSYVNDAQNDLARAMRFRRTDSVVPVNGKVAYSQLARPCVKVLQVTCGEAPRPFLNGDTGCFGISGDGPAAVTYVCLPEPLRLPGDVSELPEAVHGLLVTYAVARERMAGDVGTQRGANTYLAMYESAKAKLLSHCGDIGSYTIINRY